MRFIIAGCGIGGLVAAHSLANRGHDVQLFERAAELKPVGAGISLQPNAMQAFRHLKLSFTEAKCSLSAIIKVAHRLLGDATIFDGLPFTNPGGLYRAPHSTPSRPGRLCCIAKRR